VPSVHGRLLGNRDGSLLGNREDFSVASLLCAYVLVCPQLCVCQQVFPLHVEPMSLDVSLHLSLLFWLVASLLPRRLARQPRRLGNREDLQVFSARPRRQAAHMAFRSPKQKKPYLFDLDRHHNSGWALNFQLDSWYDFSKVRSMCVFVCVCVYRFLSTYIGNEIWEKSVYFSFLMRKVTLLLIFFSIFWAWLLVWFLKSHFNTQLSALQSNH